jgi:hypothetical protein
MDYTTFKTTVLGFLGRQSGTFERGGVDLVLSATNHVIRQAQKKRDFEYLRTTGYLNCAAAGSELSSVLDAKGGSALSVKKIEAVYLYNTATNDARGAKMAFMPQAEVRRFKVGEVASRDVPLLGSLGQFAYLHGTKFFVSQAATATELTLDVVKWLPDLAAGGDSNFFTTLHDDWLVLAVVQRLNFYLKEDERVNISQAAVQLAWTSVEDWDSALVRGSSEWNTLE